MHPVGPLNSKVYWIRRVAIVVLAVAVLVGMVWFMASRTSRSSANQEQPAAVANTSAAPTLTGVLAASSGASKSTVPTSSPASSTAASSSAMASGTAVGDTAASATATTPAADSAAETAAGQSAADAAAQAAAAQAAAAQAAATQAAADAAAKSAAAQAAADAAAQAAAAVPPPPAPSYDAAGKLICPDAAIAVVATSSAASFAVGSNPILGMTITNSGTETCQRDVSGTLQTFTVLAADGTRVWSTSDCFPGEGTEVRELTPGQTLKYTVKWSGSTSVPGCAGDRAPVPAGDYSVVAQLGGLASPPAAFSITG
jgi:cytoskeletal protein RodZ